ncbi:hypothetical protein OROHE_017236 [Orobanche hederae]
MSTSTTEFEARQLSLPKPLHTVSPHIDSLLYDAVSNSLALRHSDSSYSLYPSFFPLSLASFPSPQFLVPSPTSSATFIHLRTAASSNTITLFLVSSPVDRTTAALLRFYILRGGRFVKIRVVSSHRDLEFDRARFGAVFRVNHGVSMKLYGGINVFSLYSVSNSKIWVFSLRLLGDEGAGETLKLMKCAVIDCHSPVYAVGFSFGFLILGEDNGVRIFPLQPLMKGNHRKEKKIGGTRNNLRNGSTNGTDVAKVGNGVKLRTVKLRQGSKDVGAFFVAFEDKDVEDSMSMKMSRRSVKAISIQALSAHYYVVLDNTGDVHLLSLSYSLQGLDNSLLMKRLTLTMKVLKMAAFHDVSKVTQTIWISDGCHSVHLMMVPDMDTFFGKTEKKDSNEKLLQTSVTQAIFSSEKIQEIVPLAANAILILGQVKYVCLCDCLNLHDVLFRKWIVLWRWINASDTSYYVFSRRTLGLSMSNDDTF